MFVSSLTLPLFRGSGKDAEIEEGTSAEVLDIDTELMLRVREGDEEALAMLIERWKNPLLNFFYRSLSSYGHAEDLAQVTFIRLYRSAHRYEPKAKFSTYLFHIARRLLINEYRRQQRKPVDSIDPSELRAVDPGDSQQQISEIEEAFARAIKRLPEKHASALLLLKQQELSYEEIADVMGATVGAVKTWIFRAREQLKHELKELL